MADDRGEPGALTPLRDPDMPADIDAAANIDASSVNAEASVDSPGSTLRASAAQLAEPSTVPSDTLEIQPSVAATSVSFASPSRLVTTSYAESGQGALSPSDTVFSADATSPSDTVYTPERATSPDTVFTNTPERARSPDTVLTETPEKKDDDTLHDSWTEPSLPPENDDKRPSSRDKVRNVVRSGLIRGSNSPTHDVTEADDLAAQAAEKALTRVDDAVEAKERGKKEREEKVIQAERAAERGRTKTQKAARRYFMFRSRSRSASPGWKPPQLMRTKNSTSLARGDMSPEKKPVKKSSSWFGNKKKKPKKKKELFGSPPKKKGFMSRMQENFAVLKENDTVVVVQQWDGVEINVDVLKPCKVAVLRQKVRQYIAKRDDIMPEVEKHEHLRHRYVLLFQGQMLEDEDTVPKGVYGEVKEDEWPNKVYVARSKYRPPFEESEIDVDSLPSEWSIGTGSVSIKPLEYEEPEEEKDEDAEEALRRSQESQRRSQEMSARRRGKATKNKSVASKMHPHSASFDLRRELKLLRCPLHIVERLCSYGYDDRGSFAALSEDVLQSAPLYVDRKTRRKIVALAEIYRQQDLRDEAAPTNYLAKRSIEEKQDAKAFQTGDEEFFGKKSEMNRHWAKKAYQKQDLHDVSSLQEGGVSIPQPNGQKHPEIMRPSASIEPGPLLNEVDSLGGFDLQQSTIITKDHPTLTEDDRSVWSQLSAPARYQKKKLWTDPRFRHVGSIGKFVPCFEEDGEPTLQDRIDILLQPVAAGCRGDHRDCVDALVETFMDVFAKEKKRDHILREFFLKNDGKLRGYECIGTRPIAPKRFTSDVEKLGGPAIKLDKDEDREKSIRRFCVTLYQNIAGRRKPPSGSLEQNRLAQLQEEVAEYEAELPKDPLQRIRESILRDRPPRPPRSNRTKRLITDIQSHSRVMLDDDDLPNSELLLDEGGRDRPRRYCCEKHAWRALGRVADLAEAHRDMCCREVELALDRCSTFSPSHDELRDFVGTLLERRAVVERNGQAWRDHVADKEKSLQNSGGYVEDDKSKNIKDMAQRARQLVAADESAQDEMAAHLKKVDKGALEQGADFYKATAVEEAKATRVPKILEDDDDQRKQLVKDVATCLKCAERPFVSGSLPDAGTYDPGTLAARCGAIAARLVVEQALPQEQDAVFELLRRRTAVVHDPNREDDTKVKPTSGSYDAWAKHCRTVDKYLYYRDSFQLNDAMSYDDDVPSEAESAPEE